MMRLKKQARRWLATTTAGLFLMALPATAFADGEGGGSGDPPPPEEELPTSGLSDTETTYKGAIMLRGDQEVTLDSVVPGYVGDESYQADGRYAYFNGNTLYAGVQDDVGNYVDMIAEFFWFRSSIDRGADFYVAVVKARTSPAPTEWVLERNGYNFLGHFTSDDEATLYLRAQTDVSGGDSAFRWDWSIPFDNYGWDAFGNVTMNTKYGLSADAEGSAQKAFEANDGNGGSAEATVQAKGFLNGDFQVQTQYEVTLWRWEVLVHGGAGQIDWQMHLHSGDRERQNAYHEFFVVMQSDLGVPFKLDWLEVGGSVKKPKLFWWDEHRSLSAAVTGIVLRPPTLPESGGETENGPDGTKPGGDDGEYEDDDYVGERPSSGAVLPQSEGGCAVSGKSRGDLSGLLLLGLLAGLRRRRRR